MGQAKNRGNSEQRAAQAIARERAKLPASVKCDTCQADLTDIAPQNTRGIPGLHAAGTAFCYDCNAPTLFLDGTPEGMTLAAAAWQSAFLDES